MNKKDIKKVVLAYSGGLDTSIIIPWLKENYNNPEIIAVSGNVGQAGELEGLEEKAIKTGASKLYIEDLTKEFLEDYVFPCVQAGALYEDYMLGTAFARPPIAKRIAEIAIAEGADAICHGCTGKGNDQVRFELAIKAFAPDMPIIAPWREWDIKSREEEIDYAEAHNVPLKINRETNYSKDKNIWHLSHEGLDLEDPKNEPQYNKPGFLEMGVSPETAPDKPTYVTVHFEKGVPTAVDGREMGAVELVDTLNKLGGANGIGLLDIVENRLVGMKCRGVYETPGGAILYKAHSVLESICLDKETAHYKSLIAQKLAEDAGAMGLITGESIGQVASQTLQSLAATNDVCTMPVFRPVIGFDKQEIIDLSEKIGTYETSIQPYEDCCTIFVAKHPVTRPNINVIRGSEKRLGEKMEELVREALNTTERILCQGR